MVMTDGTRAVKKVQYSTLQYTTVQGTTRRTHGENTGIRRSRSRNSSSSSSKTSAIVRSSCCVQEKFLVESAEVD